MSAIQELTEIAMREAPAVFTAWGLAVCADREGMPHRICLAIGVAALLALMPPPARAGEIVMHMHSRHDPEISDTSGKQLNGWNPGAGYIADNGLTAGAYLNSYRRPSAYFGVTREWPIAGPLRAGGIAAVVWGYKADTGARWTGMAGVSVSWGLSENARVRVIAAPRVGSGHGLVHLAVAVEP